jgi:hypothetical protein
MSAAFRAHSDNEYLEFKRVENKTSKRPDLHAFMLLDKLDPGAPQPGSPQPFCMVFHAVYEKIWLGVDVNTVAANIADEQIVELVRCGVCYDGESFYMYS